MTTFFDDLVFSQLRVEPDEAAMLATESLWWPKDDRQKPTQLCFEFYNVPSFFLAPSQVLGLHAVGSGTGLVLDIGDSVTAAVPVYERVALRHKVRRMNVGGKDVTEWLIRILNFDRGYSFIKTGEKEAIWRLKKQLGYVAIDYDAELRRAQTSRDCTEDYFSSTARPSRSARRNSGRPSSSSSPPSTG
jgi:actin-related protein